MIAHPRVRTLPLRRHALPVMLGLCVVAGDSRLAAAASRNSGKAWERAIVTLEVTRKQYDYMQPWSPRSGSALKAGVVIGPGEILTTAADFPDRTVVRAQRGGRGSWYAAAVDWVDYPANLALVRVPDPDFWTGLKPVRLANRLSPESTLRIARWRGGNLDLRSAEFNRFVVNNPNAGEAAHVVLEVNTEMDGAGWGEPLTLDGEMAGLVYAQSGNLCQVLPAPYLRDLLEARRRGTYQGLGYFDFTWQPTENPETLRYLRVPGRDHGVVVIQIPKLSPTASVLRPRDVLLEVDGFVIDSQGDYVDPIYGNLMLEALSTRGHWAGDRIRLKIWREGQALEVDLQLPGIANAPRLVRESGYDRPPEYLIVSGLVFQPLTRSYLRSWGQDWQRSAPFRLAYFHHEDPTAERPSIVVLSMVLPDLANLGYQEVRNLVLERANGRPVSNLTELASALTQPVEGFHRLEFLAGESLQRVVLDARQAPAATQRVLNRYEIQSDRVIHPAAGS